MNRRRFLGLFGLGAAGIALEHAIPLGRVWSFPKEIIIADPDFYVNAAAFLYAEDLRCHAELVTGTVPVKFYNYQVKGGHIRASEIRRLNLAS